MSDDGYEFFEHTADVGLRILGATLQELFIHAAQGLTALLVEESPVDKTETRPMQLTAPSVPELLRLWLNELLFWFNTDRFLFAEATFTTLTATALQAQVAGERFHPARHAQGTEVKGVTYHQFQVVQTPQGWHAEIIVDV